ncbi:hypothetical protein [Burkholderia sp. GbtcB21]|uniref:hypothetical protein n=1 Tax=Burkholderia sp. GbtcB21 TaxID=2824766 RepID=UPI001C2FB17B|nr:hypothetical protein [Burkholderia sp. GbtcB21]
MADPKVGEMLLHDYILPPLYDGQYRLDVSTGVTVGGGDKPLDHRIAYFNVEGPRFTLAAPEVSGMFPPKNGHGPFDEAIPHVALGRRTLPWERPFSAARASVDGTPVNAGGTPIPWMALLIFEDGECTIETKQKIGDKLPTAVVDRLGVPRDLLVDTVTAPRDLVADLMPAYEELALLTHVRQVNVDDRELAAGDSDGFFAVVMGNRLPQRGRKYRCCLVSIEERTDIVPELPPAPDLGFHIVDTLAMADTVLVDYPVGGAPPPGTRTTLPLDVAVGAAPAAMPGPAMASARDDMRALTLAERIQAPHVRLFQTSLVLLTTWVFECEGSASFRALMQALDVGMIGKPHDGGPEILDTGHLRVESINRLGAPETVFYRGPLVGTPLTRDTNGPYHSADQARRVAPDVGAEDVSYACAFEVGRLLAAADARLAQELMRWRRGAYLRSALTDSRRFMKDYLRIVQLIDDHLPMAAFFATQVVGRMNAGCGPLADPTGLATLAAVPGFNIELVRETFSLDTLDHARALLGTGDALLGTAVDAPPLALGGIETLDAVLRDTVGLARLQSLRGQLLDNVKAQLGPFGRTTR